MLLPKHFVGQVGNPAADCQIGLLCGAANPGCSRLSAGSLRLAIRRFLPQETLPKGSSVARVNASSVAADLAPSAGVLSAVDPFYAATSSRPTRRQDRRRYLGLTSRGVTLVEMLIV